MRLAAVTDELAKIMSGNRGDGERCAVTVAMPDEVVSPSSCRPSMDGLMVSLVSQVVTKNTTLLAPAGVRIYK